MRVKTLEDLSSAFFQINERLEKEEAWATSVHGCVDHNAQLLTQACERLPKLEETSAKADSVQAALVLKLTAEPREALEHVHAQDVSRDAKMKEEIDSMTANVSTCYDELSHRLDALQHELAAVGRPAGFAAHAFPPDLPPALLGAGVPPDAW